MGIPEHAPYDKILVSAGSVEVPKELVGQLKTKGVMVIPVSSAIIRVTKVSPKETEEETFEGFAFVPLIYKDSKNNIPGI